MDILLHDKPRKTKIKTSKGKIFAMPMPTSMPMLIQIFPNGPTKLH